MKLKKILSVFIILPIISLAGCVDSRELNTLAITVCIGIDKVEDGYLVTQQIVNPKAIASQKVNNEAPVILYSDTGRDLFEAFRKLTTQCPRKIYVSHLRTVIFGEDAAKEGMEDIVDFFARDHEFRTDFYFIVAKGTTASKVLNVLTPLESIPGIELYDSLRTSESAWAPTHAIRIIELVNSIIADGKNPVLTGVEITPGMIDSNSTDALKKSSGMERLKYTSLGAFKKDKLVGWLDEDEAKAYNYIVGNVKNTVGYVNYDDDVKVTFEVTKAKSTMRAYLIKGKPAIDVEINVKHNVGGVEGAFDVSLEENQKIINKISEEKIKSICMKVVNKAQNELKTDIFGFGEAVHRQYPKVWEEIKDDWDNEFTDIPVNIAVKFETDRLGQITRPLFIREKK